MKKNKRKQTKKSLLVKALCSDLNKMSKSPWVRSIKDGKTYICPHCQLIAQPCKANPKAMCDHMLLEGTVGKEIEKALKNPELSNLGKCSICGKQFSFSSLKKNPTAEICSDCAKKSRKVRSLQFA